MIEVVLVYVMFSFNQQVMRFRLCIEEAPT